MTDKTFDELPEPHASRAAELYEIGVPATKAVGLVVDTTRGKDEREQIAEAWGVEVDTLSGYVSKGRDAIDDALRQVVSEYGGNRTILSSGSMVSYNAGASFIVAEFLTGDEYESARAGETHVARIEATGGASSGQPSVSLSIATKEVAPDLDGLADAMYRDAESLDSEELALSYNLLVDAGVPEDELESPGEKLPDSHPDSAGHVQHQLRSLERGGRR